MLNAGNTLYIAVCDPSLNDLALTRALVRKAADTFTTSCRFMVRAYPTPETLLAAQPCDICVTELSLGTMDGFALAEAVRRRRPGAEIIFACRNADNTVALRAYRENVAQILQKPIERAGDYDRLRQTLGMMVCRLIAPTKGR